jgi:uncharacterized protein (DUF2062 family)
MRAQRSISDSLQRQSKVLARARRIVTLIATPGSTAAALAAKVATTTMPIVLA